MLLFPLLQMMSPQMVDGRPPVSLQETRLIQLCTETNKPNEVKKWQAEREKYLLPETK